MDIKLHTRKTCETDGGVWLAVYSGHTVLMELTQRIVLGRLKASSTQLYEVSSTPSQPAT